MYFYKNFWLKNKGTILFTNHFYLGWKQKIRLRLTQIPWTVELSGKTAMISTKPRPLQNCYLFWTDHHLVGMSSFKRRTKVFSFYIIGELFCGFGSKLALLWALNLAFAYLFLLRETYHFKMTYHDTKDNAGLHRFILACVAGVKRGMGRGNLGARARGAREGERKQSQ